MQHGSLANQFSDVLSHSKSGHKGDFLEYGSGSDMVKRSWNFSRIEKKMKQTTDLHPAKLQN
jgi:hypothetical protein